MQYWLDAGIRELEAIAQIGRAIAIKIEKTMREILKARLRTLRVKGCVMN